MLMLALMMIAGSNREWEVSLCSSTNQPPFPPPASLRSSQSSKKPGFSQILSLKQLYLLMRYVHSMILLLLWPLRRGPSPTPPLIPFEREPPSPKTTSGGRARSSSSAIGMRNDLQRPRRRRWLHRHFCHRRYHPCGHRLRRRARLCYR